MDEEWSDAWDDGDAWDDMVDAMEARGRGGKRRARVINLFGKRPFEFSYLGNSATQDVVIRRAQPVIPFYYYHLMVRAHTLNMENAGAQFQLRAYNTLPSKQDPQEFSDSTPLLTATVPQGTSANLFIATDNNEGPFFKIVLTATQSTTAGRLYAELSAVLYCRTVGP